MLSLASPTLSRTSSQSSVGSDDSTPGHHPNGTVALENSGEGATRRTRKRFSSVQLIILEQLYRKASHPTREQREQAAVEADIDIRSVTVWFQNKRQTDRRIHRQLSESSPQLPPSPAIPLAPSSPFSDASGITIHTFRARTRTLSGDSSTSTMSTASSASRKRDRDRDAIDASTIRRHVRHRPSRGISLDDIAARAERPALLPRTPPQMSCFGSPMSLSMSSASSSPARPRTPEPLPRSATTGTKTDADAESIERKDTHERALWENMPSSPAAPDPVPRSERDLVQYGGRRITLEYACAREMVGGRQESRVREREKSSRKVKERKKRQEGQHQSHRKEKPAGSDCAERSRQEFPRREAVADEDEVPVADWDVTDTEGVLSEAPVTPSSSFGFGELSVTDEDHIGYRKQDVQDDVLRDGPTAVAKPESMQDEMMDAAYILFNLSQRG